MSARDELNELLKNCIPDSENRPCVFFQPGDNISLTYPCIVYHRKYSESNTANNFNYANNVAYDVQLISRGGSEHENILRTILETFMNSRHDNEYETEGLQHSLVTVYYRL